MKQSFSASNSIMNKTFNSNSKDYLKSNLNVNTSVLNGNSLLNGNNNTPSFNPNIHTNK
jgi:hypothetical protein